MRVSELKMKIEAEWWEWLPYFMLGLVLFMGGIMLGNHLC